MLCCPFLLGCSPVDYRDCLEIQLFDELLVQINAAGLTARKGQIVDSALVPAPIQRNSRDENARIKAGEVPEDWQENKRRQKDVHARWTKKNGKSHYGYKNHISVDRKHKIIRKFSVTSAETHDSQLLAQLLDETNSSGDVWADSAYRSGDHEEMLREANYRSRIHRKGDRNRPLMSVSSKPTLNALRCALGSSLFSPSKPSD